MLDVRLEPWLLFPIVYSRCKNLKCSFRVTVTIMQLSKYRPAARYCLHHFWWHPMFTAWTRSRHLHRFPSSVHTESLHWQSELQLPHSTSDTNSLYSTPSVLSDWVNAEPSAAIQFEGCQYHIVILLNAFYATFRMFVLIRSLARTGQWLPIFLYRT